MEIVSVEAFITKQYVFRKDNVDYNCLVQIKNNQITDVNVTSSNSMQPELSVINDIKNLISI